MAPTGGDVGDMRVNPYPDPLITASVYCEGYSDSLLDKVVRPFRQSLETVDPVAFIWTSRFGARGEHVKFRIHADIEQEEYLRTLLAEGLEAFLASLPKAATVSQKQYGSFPAIDPEDAGPGRQPDRSWQWTTYHRSPFVLGAEKLTKDDRLVGLFTHAQAAITDVVLTHLAPNHAEPGFATHRQTVFLRLVLASLAALCFDHDGRDSYLRHHRDWLIRYLVAKRKSGDVTLETMLDQYEQRVAAKQNTVHAVRRNIEATESAPSRDEMFTAWQERLTNFFGHAVNYRGHPEYDLDPYTDDYAFLPLFKLLHGAANQFGLKIPHELYVYQLLGTANGGGNKC